MFFLVFFLLFSGCSKDAAVSSDKNNEVDIVTSIDEEQGEEKLEEVQENQESEESQKKQKSEDKDEQIKSVEGNIEVHFIDVGQGDCILVKQNDTNMLIDGGDNKYGDRVVKYLKDNEVSSLNYVIGTHPHADHIGGLDDVINTFNIEKVIMPKVTHTTQTFEDVILAIKSKNMKITTPVIGDKYKLGDAEFIILAPNSSSYDNLNDYSVGIRLEFLSNSFVFTGDAEEKSEKEMVENGLNLKANVLKLGHHGSSTSTIETFLSKVDPKYAVIQVGAENKYNHPDKEVLNKLRDRGIKIYRNDLNGNIVFIGDGKNLTVNIGKLESESQNNKEEKEEGVYIGNKNSKIFHKPSCNSLPADKNRIIFNSKEEAINEGYRECKRCNP